MRNVTTIPGSANERAFAPRDALEVYFHDVAAQRLLTAEEEVRLARKIEALDLGCFAELLSFAPAVGYVAALLEASLDNSLSEFRALRSHAAAARTTRRRAEQDSLLACAQGVAALLRPLDLDRRHRDLVLADLRRIARGDDDRKGCGRLPFGARSRGFTAFLERASRTARAADRARAAFVEANLRLVLAVARKYDLGGLPFGDLVQEGNLGLIKAVDRFDHNRGLRFSTYATWWIRHNVGRALAEKSRTIRLPVHIVDSKQRIARVQRTLAAKLGRQPTLQEVAAGANLTTAKVEHVAGKLPQYAVSLDAPIGKESTTTRLEVFRDPSCDAKTPFDDLAAKNTRGLIRDLLAKLKPIEADVIRQRFGLEDDDARTLQHIADQYALSRERIRQIQELAFAKLRRSLQAIEAS